MRTPLCPNHGLAVYELVHSFATCLGALHTHASKEGYHIHHRHSLPAYSVHIHHSIRRACSKDDHPSPAHLTHLATDLKHAEQTPCGNVGENPRVGT